MDKNVALTLYKSLILPHIDYGDIIYMTASKEALKKLQLLQNVCCRIVLMAENRAHLIDMHKELGLMFLEDRRNVHLGETCHKNLYTEQPQSLTKYLHRVNEGQARTTRQRNHGNLQVPRCRTVAGGKAFSVRGPSFWNSLDNDLKLIEKFTEFTQEIRRILDQTYDNHPT